MQGKDNLSNNLFKQIKSLSQKKYRQQYQQFIVEGYKSVNEVLNSKYKIDYLIVNQNFKEKLNTSINPIVLKNADFNKLSQLHTPNGLMAIVQIPKEKPITTEGLILVLDNINDPGNLGTIIRLADWFGVAQIICSPDTVDVYNPKVIQASMGSFLRIPISYQNLDLYLSQSRYPVFGTFINGNSIYTTPLPTNAIIVMGNEANGISKNIENYMKNRITIPHFSHNQTESLNVAMATAIILSEFKRNIII